MLYVVGLPAFLKGLKKDLISSKFFGIYGEVISISIDKSKKFSKKDKNEKLMSMYITYEDNISAAFAILCLNKFKLNNVKLRTSYGRTRYCFYFINQQPCWKFNCTYIHSFIESKFCLFKGDEKKKKIKHTKILEELLTNW